MPESRSDLLKISPELKSGRMWHDPQNCSFPELEESVSILSKVHPLQPEEKKVRQKTSTVAQMMVQQPENIPVSPGLQPGVFQVTSSNSPRAALPQPCRAQLWGLLPVCSKGDQAQNRPRGWDGAPCSSRPYLAGCPWAGTGGLSFVRLSVLLPTARPEFAARDNWSYKVPTLLSMSTLITAGPADLQVQNRLEHCDHPRQIPVTSRHPQAALSTAPPAQFSIHSFPCPLRPFHSSIQHLLSKTCLKLFYLNMSSSHKK